MSERMTQQDVAKIRAEIEHRILVVRKQALEDVKEARAHGDLSENFEYHAAKKFKNENESRIRYLEKLLKNAQIVEDTSAEDEVGLDDTVELYFADDEITEEYKLVTSIRADSLRHLISIESPIGKAISGHKVGDEVIVRPSETVSFKVIIKDIVKADDEDESIRRY